MARSRIPILLSAICIILMTFGIDSISSANVSNTSTSDKVKYVRCLFTTSYNYGVIRDLYTCEISGRLHITRRGTSINRIDGFHMQGKRTKEVQAFKGDASIINYFPKDLEKQFPNLIVILLNLVQLKEIRQTDLKPFTDLRYLDLFENKIEFLEADLFKYNRRLEVIWLSNNKIKFIDDNVFQGLGITSLFLAYNECVSKSVNDNPTSLMYFLDLIKISCGVKSKNAKYNPKDRLVNDDDYDDDLLPEEKTSNETEAIIQGLTAQLRTVEDEVARLKKKREQALNWLVQYEDENKKLKAEQNETIAKMTALEENLKKTENTGVDFVKQLFALRMDLNKQSESTNGIVVDLKNKINTDKETLKNMESDLSKIRDQNFKLFEENRKLNQNYDALKDSKDGRDVTFITVIVLMAMTLVGVVGFNFYKKIRVSPMIRKFNDFENATMKLVDEDHNGSASVH
ncbi:uncharacterized protein [Chironomus tepperi]|uniref:uncharacterized protein n=1 Tax=Chironomus tepperi TaxID=113505 RepID=UPI00391FAD01